MGPAASLRWQPEGTFLRDFEAQGMVGDSWVTFVLLHSNSATRLVVDAMLYVYVQRELTRNDPKWGPLDSSY